ncbi:Protein of unknown function DUF4817 [Trinorchestia longiramus]|nr:Protein of unknown function DUF4817 [Trinorchestia longiramus]
MQLTNERCIFINNVYAERKSLKEVQHEFEQKFPERSSPTKKTVWKTVYKFRTHGTILNLNKENSGRLKNSCLDEPPEHINDVPTTWSGQASWVDDVLTYSCPDGQATDYGVFNESITCTDTGTYEPVNSDFNMTTLMQKFVCKPACSGPPLDPPDRGDYDFEDNFIEGSVVKYWCIGSTFVGGEETVMSNCTDGNWTLTVMPECGESWQVTDSFAEFREEKDIRVSNNSRSANLTNRVYSANLTNRVYSANLTNRVYCANLTNHVYCANLTNHVYCANLTNHVYSANLTNHVYCANLTNHVYCANLTNHVYCANLTNRVYCANLTNRV